MYGWRARIGHINPAVVAETILYDFFKMVPDGVSLVTTNLTIRALDNEDIERAFLEIDKAALILAEREVDIIIIGGGPMIRLKGKGSDLEIINRISGKTGILTTTSQTAAIEAFQELGAKKLVVATPYHDDQNRQVKDFLEDNGLQVLNIRGLSKNVAEIHAIPLARAYRHVKSAFLERGDADAVYVPCAHFSVPYVDQLEREIGRPVITSTTAMVWAAFKKLAIRPGITDKGQLLASLG